MSQRRAKKKPPTGSGKPPILGSDCGPAVVAAICAAIEAGNSRRCAAGLAGVSETVVGNWLRRGRSGEQPYADFVGRVRLAEARAEGSRVTIVMAAAITSWQAAAYWLERRRWKLWGRRDQALAAIEAGKALRKASPEAQREFDAMVDALAEQKAKLIIARRGVRTEEAKAHGTPAQKSA